MRPLASRGVFVFLLGASLACANGVSSTPSDRVRELARQLDESGIGCEKLTLKTREESSGADTRDGVLYSGPVAEATGFCVLSGTPDVNGVPLASMLMVFEDDSHLAQLPPTAMLRGGDRVPEQALVYGDDWEMLVVPSELGAAVAEALDGTVQKADK